MIPRRAMTKSYYNESLNFDEKLLTNLEVKLQLFFYIFIKRMISTNKKYLPHLNKTLIILQKLQNH